jgi:hypothetical protein
MATLTVASNTPAGFYDVLLVGDSTDANGTPNACLSPFGQATSPQDGAYLGDLDYNVVPYIDPPTRSGNSFTVTAGPSTSLADRTWSPGATTIPLSILAAPAGIVSGYMNGSNVVPGSCLSRAGDGVNATFNSECPFALVTPNSVVGLSATFSFTAPHNPTPGIFTPGQLTVTGISGQYGTEPGQIYPFGGFAGPAIQVFGTTEYATAGDDMYGFPPNCGQQLIHVHKQPVYIAKQESGSIAFNNNATFANAVFCQAWLYELGLNSTGVFLNPAYPAWQNESFHYRFELRDNSNSTHGEIFLDTPLHGSDCEIINKVRRCLPLIRYGSVARDHTIIPKDVQNPYYITLSGTDVDGQGDNTLTVEATDTGGAFYGSPHDDTNKLALNNGTGISHVDIYAGVIHNPIITFPSNMVLGTCNIPPPAPSPLTGVLTLCPDATNIYGVYYTEIPRKDKNRTLGQDPEAILQKGLRND